MKAHEGFAGVTGVVEITGKNQERAAIVRST